MKSLYPRRPFVVTADFISSVARRLKILGNNLDDFYARRVFATSA